tara:strand:- start:407 stop:1048 length:642 start_codon:yes stop_codon:yes gene_type:complete
MSLKSQYIESYNSLLESARIQDSDLSLKLKTILKSSHPKYKELSKLINKIGKNGRSSYFSEVIFSEYDFSVHKNENETEHSYAMLVQGKYDDLKDVATSIFGYNSATFHEFFPSHFDLGQKVITFSHTLRDKDDVDVVINRLDPLVKIAENTHLVYKKRNRNLIDRIFNRKGSISFSLNGPQFEVMSILYSLCIKDEKVNQWGKSLPQSPCFQ